MNPGPGAGKPEIPAAVPGRIAVVGPCASGKSELVARLRALGYDVRHCAQEHSYVPDMWQRLSRPQVLVYLDASLGAIGRRRKIDYGEAYLAEQRARLAHARAHCQLYVHTDDLDPEGVLAVAVAGLRGLGVGLAAR
jgi:hypothetical protein